LLFSKAVFLRIFFAVIYPLIHISVCNSIHEFDFVEQINKMTKPSHNFHRFFGEKAQAFNAKAQAFCCTVSAFSSNYQPIINYQSVKLENYVLQQNDPSKARC
jgi:hypothetical protein